MYSCLSYIDPPLRVTLLLANQEQVRGSCVSFESLGAVGSSSGRLCVSFSRAWESLDQAVVDCVFLSRAWKPLDQAVRGSCVSFESLRAVESSSCRLCVSFESLGAVGSSSTRIVCFLREALIRHLRSEEHTSELSHRSLSRMPSSA